MDPVPDPLLLRKSGSAGNRTRDLCICSQKWKFSLPGSVPLLVISGVISSRDCHLPMFGSVHLRHMVYRLVTGWLHWVFSNKIEATRCLWWKERNFKQNSSIRKKVKSRMTNTGRVLAFIDSRTTRAALAPGAAQLAVLILRLLA